eukprot:1157266-Pelagomonas_calceolata.AAC.9
MRLHWASVDKAFKEHLQRYEACVRWLHAKTNKTTYFEGDQSVLDHAAGAKQAQTSALGFLGQSKSK